jgi:UDP-N-acetylglucosamine transferase subunit ALG13
VILAILGTHGSPMDRVQRGLEDYGRVHPSETILIQSAASSWESSAAKVVGILPEAELREMVRRARVVVTHGGPGAIMLALAGGHRPIVVPREPRYGEHVDDHQVRFVSWLAQHRDIEIIRDINSLAGSIDQAVRVRESGDLHRQTGTAPTPETISCLRRVLGLD